MYDKAKKEGPIMKKPLVGITCHNKLNEEDWFKGYEINYLGVSETQSIIKAGGVPLMLPQTNNEAIIDAYLENIDGLVVIGGEDVNPAYYHEDVSSLSGPINDVRDEFEALLIKSAVNKKIPLFLICRGLQFFNVLYQGSLWQDLKLIPHNKLNIPHQGWNLSYKNIHRLNVVDKDSYFYNIIKNDYLYVNSLHHQTINKLSPLLKIVAQSDDGVIEVVESNIQDHFIIGFQYHPEISSYYYHDDNTRLFDYFINYLKEIA